MGRGAGALTDDTGEVVPLGVTPPAPPAGPPPRSSKLHSTSVLLTGASAVLAIASTLAFVTVGWSGAARRVIVAVLLTSILVLFASTAAAVLTAARDTYTSKR